jgi:hypothetical protein
MQNAPEISETPRPTPLAGPALGSILACLWEARARIAVMALTGLIVVGALAAIVFLFRPVRQENALAFQLNFEGVAKGAYPDGSRFSPSDIVNTTVLQEVYRRNALNRFIEFEDFNDAIAVTSANPELDRLRREYGDRLQDRRLTPADKRKLEDEYADRAALLQNGKFTLVLDLDRPFERWPENLAGKVLDDTLSVWAGQSRDRGVFKFDLNTFSDKILDDLDPETDDYPMLLDRMRVSIERILLNLEDLEEIPGARLIRVGENHLSLGEVKLMLQDDVKYRLKMIEAPVYATGLYRAPTLAAAYVREQLARLQRETDAVQNRITSARQALRDYEASRLGVTSVRGEKRETFAAPAASIGDSFIDRVLDLSTRATDTSFRQGLVRSILALNDTLADLANEREVYVNMQASLARQRAAGDTAGSDVEPWVAGQIKTLMAEVRRELGYVRLLHAAISERNLQPSMVYTVPDPVLQVRVSPLGLRAIVLLSAFVWLSYVAAMLAVFAWRRVARA